MILKKKSSKSCRLVLSPAVFCISTPQYLNYSVVMVSFVFRLDQRVLAKFIVSYSPTFGALHEKLTVQIVVYYSLCVDSGPRRCPDRGNAGDALVFSQELWLLYALGLYTCRKIHPPN